MTFDEWWNAAYEVGPSDDYYIAKDGWDARQAEVDILKEYVWLEHQKVIDYKDRMEAMYEFLIKHDLFDKWVEANKWFQGSQT